MGQVQEVGACAAGIWQLGSLVGVEQSALSVMRPIALRPNLAIGLPLANEGGCDRPQLKPMPISRGVKDAAQIAMDSSYCFRITANLIAG